MAIIYKHNGVIIIILCLLGGSVLAGEPGATPPQVPANIADILAVAGSTADEGVVTGGEEVWNGRSIDPAMQPAQVSSDPLPPEPASPAAVERYRVQLEARLYERYNNLPEFAGRVSRVVIVQSRPLEYSVDGTLIRAEFDQLVFDPWGKRLPELEKEYFIVTFGTGGVQQVRSDPSIRVGLDMEQVYSEHSPVTADPFAGVEDDPAFRRSGRTMPDWWRPGSTE